jgi:Flp pilus assembly protein TadG
MGRISRGMRRLFPAERGNVTVMFALSLLLLLVAMGSVVDYVNLVKERTELNAATDATVLAGLTAAIQADKAGRATAQNLGQQAAIAMWKANVGPWLEDAADAPNINIAKNGTIWTATVDFRGRYPTNFMNLVGIKTMPLVSHAQASTALAQQKNFWQFHIAVDTSNSMGIGATAADMTAISTKVMSGCTFACHSDGKVFADTYTTAHNLGIKLRLDVVNDAVAAMVNQMQSLNDGTHFKARLVGMDRDANELVAMTPNLSSIVNYKIALPLALVESNMSTGETDYNTSFATLTNSVPAAGDGSAAAKARQAVFIVTDGVHDSYTSEPNAVYHWSNYHHYLGPVDPDFCQKMKDNGALVGVLYINYIPPTGYEKVITPYQSNISPDLKACASDNMFFNATSAQDIQNALSQMLTSALSSTIPRLTQ